MADQARKTLEERAQMTDLERLRHSSAHVLATAILRIWPDAQLAAGPPVDTGFYYDMELDHRITPEDFEQIEQEMKKVCKENQKFERVVLSRDEAMAMAQSGRLGGLSERNEPSKFKLDILEGIPEGEEISIFQNGEFTDLCAGPHVGFTSKCKAFKVMNVASAYYKGDANNPQLQRVYGTAFPNKTELAAYLEQLEEAKKRDHRKLGRELDLFHIDEEVGQGLILWMPKGAIIRQELQDFISEELTKQDYQQVFTPNIGKLDLYRKSGHYPYYQDSQYPPVVDRDTLRGLADEGCSCSDLSNRLEAGEIDGYLLKPMNCPHHIKIFAARHHSYRDMPVRLAEFGTVYRWEMSGELGGMTRVRGFTQDDAHLFCTPDQVEDEIIGCLDLVKKVLNTLGMEDYRVRVSLRDPDSTKYVGKAENWDRAEESLRKAASNFGVPFTEAPGEAAFYGPKIDFLVKDVIGREWQLGTVQVDYNLPLRFDLSYIGADNKAHVPVMIHRAPFGSMERFVGVLIEHFAGHFPTWLAPEQIRVLSISEKHQAYAEEVFAKIRAVTGLRATLDVEGEKIGAKIRLAQLAKVPYMLVIGAKEEESKQVTVRHRNRGDLGSVELSSFLEQVEKEIRERSL
ncbi:MAG: threonyl-tRNA synthetase [Verrucomicrobiales bacterium]|jgi:threonyl-tRNA synthetase